MVPNSLGPGELLLHFGTKAQQDFWLPRLAAAQEIPCFGLTSREAGSDAAAMRDSGVVCRGIWESRETLGINGTCAHTARLGGAHEAALLEHLQVLHHRRQGNV